MGLEDKYLDLLQNIEFAIVAAYRNDLEVRDWDAIKALEALIQHYRHKAAGRETSPPAPDLDGAPLDIFNAVNSILQMREDLLGEKEDKPARPRFSRVLREPAGEEIILACLRKIEKSAKRWNKRNGERGYLDFVKDYVP